MPTPIGRSIAFIGLVLLSPVLVGLAILVRLTSPGPALYRARRMGPDGQFSVHKLRTMTVGAASSGQGVTASGDPRVTSLGRLLRRTKLDELPQLWNVVRGDMALVGPRPEDPRYIDWDDPLHRLVFSALPGITGPTAIEYRDEEAILASTALEVARMDGRTKASADDLDRAYRQVVLPAKLAMDAEYLRTRSARGDLAIIGRTIGQMLPQTIFRRPSSGR